MYKAMLLNFWSEINQMLNERSKNRKAKHWLNNMESNLERYQRN